MAIRDRRFKAKDLIRIIKKHLEAEESKLIWPILRRSGACELSADDLIYIICTNLQPSDATAFYERLLANNPCGFLYDLSGYALLQVFDNIHDKTGFLRKILIEKEKGDWVEYLQKEDLDLLLNVILADPSSPHHLTDADEICKSMVFINDNVGLLSAGVAALVAVEMILGLLVIFFPAIAGAWLGKLLLWLVGFQSLLIAVSFAVDGLNQIFNWVFLPAMKCSTPGTGVPHFIVPEIPEMEEERLKDLFEQGQG
jgi:hypothetical protein